MFSKLFWEDAGERAGKTFAQALLAALLVAGVSLTALSWPAVLANAGTAALVSLLTSVVSLPVNGNGGASLLRAVAPGRHEANHPRTPEV